MVCFRKDNLIEGKKPPRTISGLQVSVGDRLTATYKVTTSQRFHQLSCRRDLFFCGGRFVEVADQADADARAVVRAAASMRAGQLLLPAEGRLDLAVGHAATVFDDTVADDDPFELGKGAVYAYRFDPRTSQWNETAKLTVPEPATNVAYRFGKQISLDGNLALIGSEAGAYGPAPPAVYDGAYVFRFDPEGCQGDGCSPWVFETKLVSSDHTFGDRFGGSVAIHGDLALVGAWGVWNPSIPCWANPPASDLCVAGAAYVFAFDGTEWVEQAKLISSDIDESDALGWFVAISGETALVGAPGNDDAGYRSGAAYFFGGLADCNENNSMDICDIASGSSEDDNANGTPDECECPADFDGDGMVGAFDLAFLLGAWGPNPNHPADLDADGIVTAFDLAVLLGAWGPCE